MAYVEAYDDVFFWRTVLSRFETPERYFEVMLPSRVGKLERGKKAAMMRLLSARVGRSMLACVDADYDFLTQGASETSRQMLQNPYVLHTYAYAIENLQCYAPTLRDVCVAVTLNDHMVFNIEEYLREYSQANGASGTTAATVTRSSPSAISARSSKRAISPFRRHPRYCNASGERSAPVWHSYSASTPMPRSRISK